MKRILVAVLLAASLIAACSPLSPGKTDLEVVDDPIYRCSPRDSMPIDLQPVLMAGRLFTAFRGDRGTYICTESTNPCWMYIEIRSIATGAVVEYFYMSRKYVSEDDHCETDAAETCASWGSSDERCGKLINWVIWLSYVWYAVETWDNGRFEPACMSMGWDKIKWEFQHPQLDGTWEFWWVKPGSDNIPTFTCE